MLSSIQTTVFNRKFAPIQYNLASNNQFEAKNNKFNSKAALGAALGSVASLAFVMKSQKVNNPFKVDYRLKDMLIMSASSILTGTAFGMYKESKKSKENKFKEGVFQLLNASIPAVFGAGALTLCSKTEKFNNNLAKIPALVAAVALGMVCALKTANKLFDPKDKYPDRKLALKDCIANLDDVAGVLALAKFPLIQTLKLDKLLPLAYMYCGYRAGKAELSEMQNNIN